MYTKLFCYINVWPFIVKMHGILQTAFSGFQM